MRMPIIVQYDFNFQIQTQFNKISIPSFKFLPKTMLYSELEKYLKLGANICPYHTLSFGKGELRALNEGALYKVAYQL